MSTEKQKTIVYVRTDLCDQELLSGGSVAHTLGVLQGFRQLGYQIVCASSCMHTVLAQQNLKTVIKLSNPQWFAFLRWKINCFLSSFFFYKQISIAVRSNDIAFVYQRYSLLNMTGIVLARRFNKKLILEYNGSEAWIATHWIKKKRWITFSWLMYWVEKINISQADYVVVVSQVLQDELVARGVTQKKIIVNPNGVDTDMYKS